MENFVYETHYIPDSRLPFIFHRDFRVMNHCVPNWHANIELLYCTQGRGQIRYGPSLFPFHAGMLFVVNADVPHCVLSDTEVVYHCLIIDNGFCRDNGIPIETLYFQPAIEDPRMGQFFLPLADAFDDPDQPMATTDIRYGVLSLLRLLWKNYTIPRPRMVQTSVNGRIKAALTYIRTHLANTITLDEVAAAAGISKYHLSREFKLYTGMTVIQMVNLIRCTEARNLIENGMRIYEAAGRCGFENLSYFSRAFQKVFGKPPSGFSEKK